MDERPGNNPGTVNKELWLFTRQYPQGRGEAFLESALPVWAAQFERVHIVPMFPGEGQVQLPAGVEVHRLWTDPFETSSVLRTLGSVPEVLRTMHSRAGAGVGTLAELPETLSHARQLLRRADALEHELMPRYDPRRTALLTTWMEDWVNVLGLLRQRHHQLHFTSMAHGWDLYEHRRPAGYIPYRAAQMEQVDQVICISEVGRDHLRARFPREAHKVNMAHLGTRDHGAGPWEPSAELRLVSCAYLRSPKRIDRIAAALRKMDRPVHWIHFGDGPDLEHLRCAVKDMPGHIRVELRGAVPNELVLGHYRTHPVDLFVLMSEDEGVPVALMEAASFGVPLVANDVGGVKAVVTPESGVLLPADADAVMLARALEQEGAERAADRDFRAGVRAFWARQFEAGVNYSAIARMV